MGNIQHKLPLYSKCEIKEEEIKEEEEHEGFTFTCEICIEPSNEMFTNNINCNHPYCADCMIKYIQVKLEEHVPDIKCPAPNCIKFLDILHCRSLIPHQLFVKWCDELFSLSVLKFDGRVYCPNTNCLELIVNECGGRGRITKVSCPKCKQLFCFRCEVSWHERSECKDDIALHVLAKQKRWKRCPSCRQLVERSSGCNLIYCRCRTEFCYSCGKRAMDCKCKSTGCIIIIPILLFLAVCGCFIWLIWKFLF